MAQHLARQGRVIFCIQCENLVIQTVRRFEVGHAENLAVKFEAVPQYVEAALEVEFFDQRVDEKRLQSRAVEGLHLSPQLGLTVLEEGEGARREKGVAKVPFGIGP